MTATTDSPPAARRRPATFIILWVAARLPGFAIGMAGLGKFHASARWDRLFVSWGYPTWLSKVAGVIEVAGAVLMFIPRSSVYGAAILAVTMLCAFLTLVSHPAGQLGWGATPLVYCVWLSVIVVRSRRASRL